MNTGKTLFAQLMDFLPWSTFARIVSRYGGDRAVRGLPCTEQFRAMAFAQLTYRESLRDIEACLSAQAHKLYHIGFRQPVHRSTLADANEVRDWRIYADFAHRLIAQARRLYASDRLGADLKEAVYALDSTTIDLCLSVFPWAHFRTSKAAVKMHTLLDLRGNIPSFIHVSNGKMHDVRALDMLVPEAGAIYVMDRAYVDFARLHALHQIGAFFVTRAKSNLRAHRPIGSRGLSPTRRSRWMEPAPGTSAPSTSAAFASRTRKRAGHWCFSPIRRACRRRPYVTYTRLVGRSNFSSSGSSSTCGSSASMAPRKMP
jgi:hypothetical protein